LIPPISRNPEIDIIILPVVKTYQQAVLGEGKAQLGISRRNNNMLNNPVKKKGEAGHPSNFAGGIRKDDLPVCMT